MNKVVEVDLRDGVGDFRLISRQAIDALLQLKEGNRFSKGLFAGLALKKRSSIMKMWKDSTVIQNGH